MGQLQGGGATRPSSASPGCSIISQLCWNELSRSLCSELM